MPPKPPAKKVAERQAMTHFFSPDRNAEKVAQKAQETLQLAENADRLRVRLAEYLGQFHKDSRNLMVLVIAAKATHAYLERRKFDRKRWSEMVEHWYMEEGRKSMSWLRDRMALWWLNMHTRIYFTYLKGREHFQYDYITRRWIGERMGDIAPMEDFPEYVDPTNEAAVSPPKRAREPSPSKTQSRAGRGPTLEKSAKRVYISFLDALFEREPKVYKSPQGVVHWEKVYAKMMIAFGNPPELGKGNSNIYRWWNEAVNKQELINEHFDTDILTEPVGRPTAMHHFASVIRKLVAEIHYFGIPMSKSLLYEIFIQKWKDSDDPNIDMSAYEWGLPSRQTFRRWLAKMNLKARGVTKTMESALPVTCASLTSRNFDFRVLEVRY